MTDLANDHAGLTDTFASRRYFRKFEAITAHMGNVAAQMQAEGELGAQEVEIPGKGGGDVVQPHDQFGDIGVHHLGMGVDVFQRGVFDVDHRVFARRDLVARGFDARRQFGDLGLRFGHLLLGFHHLGIEIRHLLLPLSQYLSAHMGNVIMIYIPCHAEFIRSVSNST